MKRKRTNYTAQEKVALLKRHLVELVPISTLCDDAQLQPTAFYRWLKQFFENGAPHQRQWPAIHRPRFQGVHSPGRDDTRPDLASYPQSNGKAERWHHSFKSEGWRPGVPLSLDDGRRVAARYIAHYHTVGPHSAIGYVTPAMRLAGRHLDVLAARDKKLEVARQRRAERRHSAPTPLPEIA